MAVSKAKGVVHNRMCVIVLKVFMDLLAVERVPLINMELIAAMIANV